ncbi:transmembrane protease serine 9-like [Chironomus tepperi]|uniref:transmembrane protease serine 9-like n=1 Tax=Chironomus tepperi TaxID=113505 RepID=UPI00391F4FD4
MEMILLSHEECVKSIDPSHLKKLNADVHVCGRGLSGEKTCKGDAGSPVTNLVEGIPYLQGIVTFTDEDECVETETNTASVFLRVPCFYDWIHSKVPNISHVFIEKPEPKPSFNEDTGSIEIITVGESTTARPLGTTPRPRQTTRYTTTTRRVVTIPAVVTEADEGNGDDTMRTSTDGMNCGQPKIGRQTMIGGAYVKRGRYPWHAAIIHNREYQCGATVISNKRVVTAAHCVKGKHESHEHRAGDIKVLLGVHNLSSRYEIGRVTFAVKSINIHPDWNINVQTFDADIAILELDSEITFNNYIQPICLAQPESSVASNSSGVVIGFGRSENKGIEDVAKILEIPLIDYHKCSEGEDHRHLISPRTFCGGTKDGRGVCDGDSGSGVYVKHNGRTYLRGIVSSSLSTVYECDVNKYAVFTEVTKFYDWINYENGDLKVTTLGTRRKPEPVTTTTPRPRPTTTPRTTTRSTTTSRRVVTTPAVVTEANDGNDQDENGEGGNGGDGNGEDGNGEGENGEGGQDEQGSQEPDTTAKVTPRTTPRTTQIRASTRPWRKPTTSKPKTTTTVEPTVESTTEDETIHFKDPSKTDLSSELDVRAAADNTEDEVEEVTTTTTAKTPSRFPGRAQKYIKPTIETTTVNERSHFTQFEVNERMQWYRPSVSWFQNQRSFS